MRSLIEGLFLAIQWVIVIKVN